MRYYTNVFTITKQTFSDVFQKLVIDQFQHL